MEYCQYYTKYTIQKQLGNRLNFIKRIGQREKSQLISKLRRLAKEVERNLPDKAYRIRRIYIPIIKLGKIPNTKEFPELMWKAQLDLDTLIKGLNVFCEVLK